MTVFRRRPLIDHGQDDPTDDLFRLILFHPRRRRTVFHRSTFR